MTTRTQDGTDRFTEIFAHRLDADSACDLDSGWTEFRARKSTQTLAKFVARAQREGFRSTRLGRYDGTIIVRTAEL